MRQAIDHAKQTTNNDAGEFYIISYYFHYTASPI